MNKSDEAANTFSTSELNCAQSVFSTYCEPLGLDKETARKISCSFGGGMAYTGETCGAVSGALMLIGLKYGQADPEDIQAKEKTYSLTQEFSGKFKELYCSVKCKDLLGYDMTNPEELKVIKEQRLPKSICPKYVKTAAKLVEEILLFQEK